MFGVKIGDLKVVAKKIKGDQALALQLYETGNLDAMYLAGLVANGSRMSKKELNSWAKGASWKMVSEYSVPWVATESPAGRQLALKWIDSREESIASCGWNTIAAWVAVRPDAELDLDEISGLLDRVTREIHDAPHRVRYCMNNFVIAVGSAVKPLITRAKAAAKRIGKVEVEMGGTDCRVPPALETIAKIESMGRLGVKRKVARC